MHSCPKYDKLDCVRVGPGILLLSPPFPRLYKGPEVTQWWCFWVYFQISVTLTWPQTLKCHASTEWIRGKSGKNLSVTSDKLSYTSILPDCSRHTLPYYPTQWHSNRERKCNLNACIHSTPTKKKEEKKTRQLKIHETNANAGNNDSALDVCEW